MTRWRKFKRLPLIGQVVLVLFTPLAFLEIAIVSLAAITNSVGQFWSNKSEE
jgi:hypothetical protein